LILAKNLVGNVKGFLSKEPADLKISKKEIKIHIRFLLNVRLI
jgi:hypothetical protein